MAYRRPPPPLPAGYTARLVSQTATSAGYHEVGTAGVKKVNHENAVNEEL